MGGFASDRLGIGRCMGGPGGPLMLRSPKLQKWASDPEWAQNGGSQNCTPPIFLDLGSLADTQPMARESYTSSTLGREPIPNLGGQDRRSLTSNVTPTP